ncbi:hypothetical protein [Streptomyces sp. NBC_00847]|uniref:hypothetical protein n=1 Tax=unclassified Streptomyces TaxID=2593676 RepID=UPI002256BC91|nr:hypothetical protein [Streptomyces sp. NBC_00847]MCX4883651.1 hypothetical protein [Streptomyces sp. NBC_00847]
MPADEVTHGTDVDEFRVRTGPRHAAPKKPLFTRFHMPAGKAIATVAMPTAVLMGMGFTSSLALADSGGSGAPTAKSLTADEYKDCVAALGDDASASPSPSASASSSPSDEKATPSPSSTSSKDASDSGKAGSSGSSGSGSDDKATPTPSASESSSKDTSSGDTATPSPSASASSGGGLLNDLGDAIGGLFTGGGGSSTPSAGPTPSGSSSASASKDSSTSPGKSVTDSVKDTTKKVTDTVGDTVKDTTDTASKAADSATKTVEKAAGEATSSASPSASSGADAANCPTATDDEGGVDNKVTLPDDPWYLDASSLLLQKADYQGVVKVKTANGTTKKVLKYVVSGGVDIGDLHQTVKDKNAGKTYHVQAGSGTTSTFRDGAVTMYTESISGNLFGLIPITFSPDSPPPLNIPLIYFTHVKVVQAGQFGGTLHIPGMHVYTTDGTG